MAGRFYDHWQIGDRIEHDIRRTVTETGILYTSDAADDPQRVHLGSDGAKAKKFSQR